MFSASKLMNKRTLSDIVSCLSDYDPDALSVAQAQDIILKFIRPLQSVEKVAIRAALDRVLAADIGLLASLGVAEVPVYRRLRVAFFSTGDELRSLGEALDEGCVYDSNRYTLYGMLSRLGCDMIDMGVIRDDPAALEAAFRSAC